MLLDLRVHKVHKVHKVLKVLFKVMLVSQVHKELLAHKGLRVY